MFGLLRWKINSFLYLLVCLDWFLEKEKKKKKIIVIESKCHSHLHIDSSLLHDIMIHLHSHTTSIHVLAYQMHPKKFMRA